METTWGLHQAVVAVSDWSLTVHLNWTKWESVALSEMTAMLSWPAVNTQDCHVCYFELLVI